MCTDEKQIAFITCVNNEEEYAECQYYLSRLYVPKGYETDVISIREAPSMAAGYNAGMNSSPAKYKVYLHQDVFIKDQNFIVHMLEVFHRDARIGICGMIGKRNRKLQADALMTWDTGNVLDNVHVSGSWDFLRPSEKEFFTEVWAVDGLLMATQRDVMWREDLFDGWDLYDFSQCMEFIRRGYMVAVPRQEVPWCFHDNLYVKLERYYGYYERFMKEYFGLDGSSDPTDRTDVFSYEKEKEFARAIEDMRDGVEALFLSEDRGNLRALLDDSPGLKDQTYMREYAAIVHIDRQEEIHRSDRRFWEPGVPFQKLVRKLRSLKYQLKRLEYEGADDPDILQSILRDFSKYAIEDVCDRYVREKKKVYSLLDGYLKSEDVRK